MTERSRRASPAGAAASSRTPTPASKASATRARSKRPAPQRATAGQYQGGVYLLPATPDTVQWGWFDNAEPARARIRPGDTVVMETMMASLDQIRPGVTIEEITRLRLLDPARGPHTITGPIHIEGAEPGDVLKIRINHIVPRSYGANWNLPGALKLGEFPEVFAEPQVKWFYFDPVRHVTEFAPGIEIPVRPFPGIVGVARAEPGKYSTVPPGPFGGNIDVRELVAGTTLYLPVFVDGALLWSGDSHAAQGNGEINLTAIETAFSELSMTVDLIKKTPLAWPRIETPTHWITTGYDRDLNVALEIAREQTIRWLRDWKRVDAATARAIMARSGDFRVAEVVNQVKGIYCMLPKRGEARAPARPVKDTIGAFVTHAADADLMTAMNQAAMAMVRLVHERKQLSLLDAYSLASLTMDARIGEVSAKSKHIHCLLPRSLWTG